ncbi:MAG TPA: cyclic-di-AMP receptor [Aggregatilineaceae bacterium]|nr:cyclic-di-AMP receptor [Aggregatilineaceae bacterium]
MSTKLILVVLRGGDREKLIRCLLDAGFRVTDFSSMGGFLRRKNTTLMIGVPSDQINHALALIRETCPTPRDADEHSATIFVIRAGQFISI